MAIKLNVLRDENLVIALTEHTLTDCNFHECDDSCGCTMIESDPHILTVKGQILLINTNNELDKSDEQVTSEVDHAKKFIQWAKMSGDENCYFDLQTEITNAAGILTKQISLTNAYIINYVETFDNEHGTLRFSTDIREKAKIS